MKYDIVFITESWLNSNIPDSVVLNGSDYFICRQDRLHKLGGGYFIQIRDQTSWCLYQLEPWAYRYAMCRLALESI